MLSKLYNVEVGMIAHKSREKIQMILEGKNRSLHFKRGRKSGWLEKI